MTQPHPTNTPPPGYGTPYQPTLPPTFGQTMPRPTKRKRTVPLLLAILGTAGGLLVGCVTGTAIGAAGNTTPTAGPTVYVTVPAAETAPPDYVAPTKAPVAAVPTKPAAKPAAKPATTIADGIWTVGEDVPAGKYKLAAPITADDFCYWDTTKTGSNGDDIIDQGVPTGGRPQVVLRNGVDFTSRGCGTWVKVG